MSWQLIGVYVLLGVLLLSLNLRSRWSWWIKVGAILLTSSAYYLTYHSVNELKGWPVPDPLPERFSVHWVQVAEPDLVVDPVVLPGDDAGQVLVAGPLVEEAAVEGVDHADAALAAEFDQVEALAVA